MKKRKDKRMADDPAATKPASDAPLNEPIDDRTAEEKERTKGHRTLDEHLDANRPVRAADDDRPKYISDIERRKRDLGPEKFVSTEANPATGGVYPPSAVVTPFSAEEIAAHTPGEQTAEEEQAHRGPAPDDPQAMARDKGSPAADTTPATSDQQK